MKEQIHYHIIYVLFFIFRKLYFNIVGFLCNTIYNIDYNI